MRKRFSVVAQWLKYLRNTPNAQIKLDVKECEDLKNYLDYRHALLDLAYLNLITRYEEDFEEMLMPTESCIRHKYSVDKNMKEVGVKPSVCKYFGNGDICCGMVDCACLERNYMYCVQKQQVAELQKKYDSFWTNKFAKVK